MLCFGSPDFVRDPQPENSDRLRLMGKGFLGFDTSVLFSQTKPKNRATADIDFLFNPFSSSSLITSQKHNVIGCLFLSVPAVPRSFVTYHVQFPLARPSSDNLHAICSHSAHRPRYPETYFPVSGYGQQKRRAAAINNAEFWYSDCCRQNVTWGSETTLCCTTQAVSSRKWRFLVFLLILILFTYILWQFMALLHQRGRYRV